MNRSPNWTLRALQRVAVRTGHGRRLHLWSPAYRLATRAFAALLTRGEAGACTYARAGTGTSDLVPGVSDIDLVVVLPPDPAGEDIAAGRVRRRYERLITLLPPLRRVLDNPCVYDDAQLRDLAGASYTTYGLDRESNERAAAYRDDAALLDRRRLLERPGLHRDLDWRPVSGPDRRPSLRERDVHAERQAAWLELVFWWRLAFEACVDPSRGHAASLCVKLVAEPARIWLWLAHREAPPNRRHVLERTSELLPDEAPVLEQAIALRERLHELPRAPLAEALGALVRLSSRIAQLVTSDALAEGGRTVLLHRGELVPGAALAGPDAARYEQPPGALPLCDWRALAVPTHADESFVLDGGEPADPRAVARAALERRAGTYSALQAPSLLVFPFSALERPAPGILACPASDPVSFALAAGQAEALFPEARGCSVADVATRAVAEQRPRVLASSGSADSDRNARVLLAAARAALLHETVADGTPHLPLTLAATARLLTERVPAVDGPCADVVDAFGRGVAPSLSAVAALRDAVTELPAFRS